jgi:nucleoside-diphosphate-sugar epimerase
VSAGPVGRVLVTGAGGLLGTAVLERLACSGIKVTALDVDRGRELACDRMIIGSASDEEAVTEALAGADSVIHLAARRSPYLGTAQEVFLGNTAATFTVLDCAASAGVQRVVLASSYSITGIPFAPHDRHPAYLPVDELIPQQVEDPYGLSKQVDELSAAMMWWRHRLSVIALRFPFLGSAERELPERAAAMADDPAFGARELWTYLEIQDAASAAVAAATTPLVGFNAISLSADVTLAPYRTEDLLDAFHPNVPRRRAFSGRTAPIDTTRASALLGWRPEHTWDSEIRDLPATTGRTLR